ncbi:MAG TPA: glycoside hydrolase family 5 protein [Prolixibacteraceae bacterium]|nr:glycoside hydrolase family 5 protein [Prolixibacteraceae bacterium]HPS12736.1 glycoside hydrolase family 5 protein [Prolixibacteraceae bacterium]
MNQIFFRKFFTIILLLFGYFSYGSNPQTPVEKYGQLKIEGTTIVGQNGEPAQLTGMSFFWSQWIGKYYNDKCVDWLVSDWKCSVLRATMAVGHKGYATHPRKEQKKIETVVDAAIRDGIYVIIDFHEHNAEKFLNEAKTFFGDMAKKYGNQPNVIYEIYNEPLKVSWSKVVKPYCEEVIKTIRQYDPDNIIICGTPTWSQDVDEASLDPIKVANIAYALHFYSGTHTQWLRDKAELAMKNGCCLFVSEYGTTDANGDGKVYADETRRWYDWMDKYHIGHCNWSVADKIESSSVLQNGASAKGGWLDSEIKPSGLLVKTELVKKYHEMFQ